MEKSFPILAAGIQRCFAGKTDKLRFCLVYTSINNIILRAGTSICASSGFGPLGPKTLRGQLYTCDDSREQIVARNKRQTAARNKRQTAARNKRQTHAIKLGKYIFKI